MKAHKWIAQGALCCGLSVLLGAFGAHGLKNLATPVLLQTFETAVRYFFFHGLALVFCGTLYQQFALPGLHRVALLFKWGMVLFSGSLFLLVALSINGVAGATKLGAITPLGGLCFVLGWAQLVGLFARSAKSG